MPITVFQFFTSMAFDLTIMLPAFFSFIHSSCLFLWPCWNCHLLLFRYILFFISFKKYSLQITTSAILYLLWSCVHCSSFFILVSCCFTSPYSFFAFSQIVLSLRLLILLLMQLGLYYSTLIIILVYCLRCFLDLF